jgi:hypothetical protein
VVDNAILRSLCLLAIAAGAAPAWASSGGTGILLLLELVLLILLAALLLAALIWWRYLRIASDAVHTVAGIPVHLHHKPVTKLKKIKADALILPVGRDAWIGRSAGRAVRDAGGDVIQEELKAGGPLKEGQSRVVTGGKLRPTHVIAVNIYDENMQTSADRVGTALDTAISEAERLGARALMFADFTDVFAYGKDRTDNGFAAQSILAAIARNRAKLGRAIIYIPDGASYPNYLRAFRELDKAA